ncbi:hypothetical protein ACSNOI_45945, partial [Actinomadura kijaniata]|uniref:hypothetical protein n=1 Tax=Actinomadura kijaniata TaxID=46161 RepID=UPI003F1AE0B2
MGAVRSGDGYVEGTAELLKSLRLAAQAAHVGDQAVVHGSLRDVQDGRRRELKGIDKGQVVARRRSGHSVRQVAVGWGFWSSTTWPRPVRAHRPAHRPPRPPQSRD